MSSHQRLRTHTEPSLRSIRVYKPVAEQDWQHIQVPAPFGRPDEELPHIFETEQGPDPVDQSQVSTAQSRGGTDGEGGRTFLIGSGRADGHRSHVKSCAIRLRVLPVRRSEAVLCDGAEPAAQAGRTDGRPDGSGRPGRQVRAPKGEHDVVVGGPVGELEPPCGRGSAVADAYWVHADQRREVSVVPG